jgi:hypothetical protein
MTYAILRHDPEAPELQEQCAGPTAAGACPRVQRGEPVACAGHELLLALEGLRPFKLNVEPRATACPLTAFGISSPRRA